MSLHVTFGGNAGTLRLHLNEVLSHFTSVPHAYARDASRRDRLR